MLSLVGLLALMLMALTITPTQAQIKTSVKYSADIEHRLKTAREVEKQFRQFRKDSSDVAKKQLKRLKHTTDSLVKELKKQVTVDKLEEYVPEVSELTSQQEQALAIIKEKSAVPGKYTKINKKDLQSMIMQNVQGRPEIEQYKTMLEGKLDPYRSKYDRYKHLPQSADSLNQQAKVMDLDSAELWQKLDEFVESEAMKTNYFEALMKEQAELTQLKSNPQSMVMNDVPAFDFENHPLKTAKQAGMKHFDKLGEEKIDEAMGQLDQLKKKYAYVPDSKDLKTAKKTNSLSGVPTKKRIVFGGNFHLDIGDPLFLDLNPLIGYRANRRWTVGISGTVRIRLSYTDSTDFNYRVPTTGLRGFGEYRFFKALLAHGEYEVLADNVFSNEKQTGLGPPTQSINLGLGSTFGIYKGLKGKVLLLYNFTLDGEPRYHSPWVVRFGLLN